MIGKINQECSQIRLDFMMVKSNQRLEKPFVRKEQAFPVIGLALLNVITKKVKSTDHFENSWSNWG